MPAKPFTTLALLAFAGVALTAQAAPTRYVQAPGSSLGFVFEQAGGENSGTFKKFSTELVHDPGNPAASTLKVEVQIASLDTEDKDRDSTLLGADLFDPKRFPTAEYAAQSLVKRADGSFEAVGKLTLRGVTRDLRLSLTIRPVTVAGKAGLELSGETTIKRLEFGVGQGEWRSTEWVGDAVKLSYKVKLVPAAASAAGAK